MTFLLPLGIKGLKVNDYLQKFCFENRFYIIDNSKIKREHLFRVGLHLLESGKVILANNFIYYLNSIHSVNFDKNMKLRMQRY